jgi:hypothetical protein
MSHFAHINEKGIVDAVIVADAEYIATQADPKNWVQTSYNSRWGIHCGQDGKPDGKPALRYNYAGIGMQYDGEGFSLPQPHFSWVLNKATYQWASPIPKPEDGVYVWVEPLKDWVEIPNPTI